MDFGMGSYDGLTEESLMLPPLTFYDQASEVEQKLYVGMSSWIEVGKLLGIKEDKSRPEYFKIFNSLELNATHYKIPEEKSINKWLTTLENPGFLFCPKIYKGITHYGTLKGKESMLQQFCASMSYFGENLGPVFIQLSESFSAKRKEELFNFLERLPETQLEFFFEARNSSWFTDLKELQELTQKLHQLNIGLVITDTPLRRDVVSMHFPVKKAFIRFVCDGLQPLDFYRIDQWAEEIQVMKQNGIEAVHFFLHIHETSAVPVFYNYVIQKFTDNQVEDAGLKFFQIDNPKA